MLALPLEKKEEEEEEEEEEEKFRQTYVQTRVHVSQYSLCPLIQHRQTDTHTCVYIYIYTYMCVCIILE